MNARPVQRSKSAKSKIFLVDDHPLVRQGLTRLINQEQDLRVCGECSSADDALEAMTAVQPDLAVVDLSLAETDGIDLIKTLRKKSSRVLILVLSMHKESMYAERVLRAGAKGYIMKREPPEQVLVAIRKVLKGEIYLSDPMNNQLLEHFSQSGTPDGKSTIRSLSDRELSIFELIGSGKTTRQIADALHLSVKTIETYREHIKDKLRLQNGTELLHHAFDWVENGSKASRDIAA